MKIQCLIERKNGTRVTFGDCDRWSAGVYNFQPDPNFPDAPHLAEVTDERHLNRFLSISSYRLFMAGTPVKRRAKSTAESVPDDDTGGVLAPPKKPEVAPVVVPEEIEAIRSLTIKELKAKINTYPAESLRAAADAERANTVDTPRKCWIEVVEAHLGAAA